MYKTEEERTEARNQTYAKYRASHLEERREYNKQYVKTKEGRANSQARKYRYDDKINNRGISTLTPDWIIDNIYTKCIYCGEENWEVLGADRIDNSKPHTPENVVPCCSKCNTKHGHKSFVRFTSDKPNTVLQMLRRDQMLENAVKLCKSDSFDYICDRFFEIDYKAT